MSHDGSACAGKVGLQDLKTLQPQRLSVAIGARRLNLSQDETPMNSDRTR